MKIYFDIMPRQSGKTTELITKTKFDENCIFIGMPPAIRGLEKMRSSKLYVTPGNFTGRFLRGKKDVNLYIDEYLFFSIDNQSKINKIVCDYPFVIDNVYVKTTSPKLMDPNLYRLASMERVEPSFPVRNYIAHSLMEQYNYIFDNLLTHPKTMLMVHAYQMKKTLGWEGIRTEIVGELFSK